jgi:hypothetical protein
LHGSAVKSPAGYFDLRIATTPAARDNATMPCLLGCIALAFPRLVIILVVIFSDYIGDAFHHRILWPLLGFIFMPLTTLAYAWAWHFGSGSVQGLGLVVVIIAALIDLGMIGGGASHKKVRTYYVRK